MVIIGDGYMISETEFGELRANVASIRETISKLDSKVDRALDAVYGNNGTGIKSDVRDINSRVMELEARYINYDARLDTIADMIDSTVVSLREHLNDPRRTFQGFISDNWKAILGIVIAIQLLIELVLPSGFTIWSIIEKIF